MKSIKGKDLVGLKYKPLFPYFKDKKNAFKILSSNHVNTEDGTGIVHTAPGFGEEDFNVCKENNIDALCPVDDAGCFSDEISDIDYNLADKNVKLSIKGLQVFDTNDEIIKYLKGKDLWLKTEEIIHNYPHCWRTDTPLIYKAVNSWYVNVISIKQRMIELNQSINWIPSHIKNGMFGKWLENTKDWSITRNRFWGCPVPVWKSDNIKYPRIDVYGSIEEIESDFSEYYEKEFGEKLKVKDLHRPFIDKLKRPKNGLL